VSNNPQWYILIWETTGRLNLKRQTICSFVCLESRYSSPPLLYLTCLFNTKFLERYLSSFKLNNILKTDPPVMLKIIHVNTMEEFLKIPFQYKTFFFYQKMVPSVAFVLCNLHPCIQCSGAGKANILVPILMLRRNTEFVFELNQHKEDFFKLGLSSFFSFCSFKSPCFFFLLLCVYGIKNSMGCLSTT
jgi:hypothetical protein